MCDWCGLDGWCCRKDWVGNGCDGTIGGTNHHRCQLYPGMYVLKLYVSQGLQTTKEMLIQSFKYSLLFHRDRHMQINGRGEKKYNSTLLIKAFKSIPEN